MSSPKTKISQRSREELIDTAVQVIKNSWVSYEDAVERAEDAAYLLDRRLNGMQFQGEDEKEILAEIISNF